MKNNGEKTGLVLEGGGFRGIYTAGVLDVFLEQGLEFDGVIGVSAGAIHGCSFISGQKGRSIRYYKKYCTHKRFMSIQSWLKTGNAVETEFCYHELPEKLDPYDYQAFDRSDVKFYVTCTNVESGRAEYLQVHDMKKEIDLLRGSASLPYFSRTVAWEGKQYLDGGCSDSVPVKAFQKMGYGRNVVVLTREKGYVKKPEKIWMAKLFYRKYPAFCRALTTRHLVYNRTLKQIRDMEEAGSVFVIQPQSPLSIGRMERNRDKIQEVYDRGRKDAEESMSRLKAWLAREA